MGRYIVLIFLIIGLSVLSVEGQEKIAFRFGVLKKMSERMERAGSYCYFGGDLKLTENYFLGIDLLFDRQNDITAFFADQQSLELGTVLSFNRVILSSEELDMYIGGIGRLRFWDVNSTGINRSVKVKDMTLLLGGNIGIRWTITNDIFVNIQSDFYLINGGVNYREITEFLTDDLIEEEVNMNWNIGINTMLKIAIGKYF